MKGHILLHFWSSAPLPKQEKKKIKFLPPPPLFLEFHGHVTDKFSYFIVACQFSLKKQLNAHLTRSLNIKEIFSLFLNLLRLFYLHSLGAFDFC